MIDMMRVNTPFLNVLVQLAEDAEFSGSLNGFGSFLF